MIYIILWLIIVVQRLIELIMAKRNERWMIRNGAVIVNEGHYKWIVLTHVCFLIVLLLEAIYRHALQETVQPSLLFMFFFLQAFRLWCLVSLGRYWNTKIVYIPRAPIVRKGPYRFIRHPNYIIVGLEFFFIPLLFQSYMVACLFPILHIILMLYRIPQENEILKQLKEV
ncbi:isoprenylcysteine carboxyl methyltransferase family protein [Salirhabdus salicampi]|uniref:isoprenylcysteine carboxyl methyltransferase family protein n=1 Tax=Salirhabdus salicampi TaxID=476102 RepID=UPI0020C57D3D|nr:isoprenylcysteine carboxylmethyltransferase family protein [Salirhabdus salicampi]MCP8616083.1 isoprenylcysteine carboxyl methyltransferase [Salirhabdus salicampi]